MAGATSIRCAGCGREDFLDEKFDDCVYCGTKVSEPAPVEGRPLDSAIGRLDRILSELLSLAGSDLDEPDVQTLKHHADDMEGVAKKIRLVLALKYVPKADVQTASAVPTAPLAELEREYILRVLVSTDGNKSQAAKILGIDRRTLYRKLEDYGVEL